MSRSKVTLVCVGSAVKYVLLFQVCPEEDGIRRGTLHGLEERIHNFIQRHFNFDTTHTQTNFNWCVLKQAEIVATEMSPVSVRCDSCVTPFVFFSLPVLSVFRPLLSAESHTACLEETWSGVSVPKITVKVIASLSDERRKVFLTDVSFLFSASQQV